jgi:hypothetical protein
MELHEYAQYDAIGLCRLMRAGHVTRAEIEAIARHALEVANRETNGLASPLFSPAPHAADGPLADVPFLIKDSGPNGGRGPVLHRQPQPQRPRRVLRPQGRTVPRWRLASVALIASSSGCQ